MALGRPNCYKQYSAFHLHLHQHLQTSISGSNDCCRDAITRGTKEGTRHLWPLLVLRAVGHGESGGLSEGQIMTEDVCMEVEIDNLLDPPYAAHICS